MEDIWTQTRTDKKFSLNNINPDNVCIEDIASALSKQCRYNGHIDRFYSIAQHCICVAEGLLPQLSIYGLLHDAAEAYIGDITMPVKQYLLKNNSDLIYDLEENILEAIYYKFNLKCPDLPLQAKVKKQDNIWLVLEALNMFDSIVDNWTEKYIMLDDIKDITMEKALNPDEAEKEYIKKFYEYLKAYTENE